MSLATKQVMQLWVSITHDSGIAHSRLHVFKIDTLHASNNKIEGSPMTMKSHTPSEKSDKNICKYLEILKSY